MAETTCNKEGHCTSLDEEIIFGEAVVTATSGLFNKRSRDPKDDTHGRTQGGRIQATSSAQELFGLTISKPSAEGWYSKVLGIKDWVDARPNMILMSHFIQFPARKPEPPRVSNQNAVLHCKYHSGLPNYQQKATVQLAMPYSIIGTAGGSSRFPIGATRRPYSESPRPNYVAWAHLCTTLLGVKPCFSSLLAPNSSPHDVVSGCQ